MADAIVSAAEQAALPTAIAALKAVQQFNANMGVDPTKWVLNFPGAQAVLVGSLQLLIPSLAQAEAGALIAEANAKIGTLIANLQSKLTPK